MIDDLTQLYAHAQGRIVTLERQVEAQRRRFWWASLAYFGAGVCLGALPFLRGLVP